MEVVRGVSLEVRAGEIVTIIGPNGSGKSTLMKAIAGLLKPRAGSIVFGGESVESQPPELIVRKGLCYVPQVNNVFPSLTVEENLEMGAFTVDDDLSSRKARVFALFPRLWERRRQRAGDMSGGERQMVAMGRALMMDPRLLLLDEPSAGLAPKMADVIFTAIEAINRAGVAVLLVEQNARKALAMSHRGYVLAGGENRIEGAASSLLEDPEVARLYLGG